MSYEHGTTHYNLPQTEGSDTRDWFDTNEAFRVIDETLYSASQTAGQATQDIETVKDDISDLKDADTAMTGRVDGIEGRVAANELKIGRLETDVTDGIQDLKDSICAIEEASATAAYAHTTGEFFWYNDTLYKATTNIAIGQQIVPDTNCKTTNITTELLEGASGGVEIDDSTTSVSKVWSSSKTNNELNTKAPSADVYVKSEVYTKAEIDALLAEIGGSAMPELDYTNPLHTFGSGNHSYTATGECYITGFIAGGANRLSINGTEVASGTNGYNGNSTNDNVPLLRLSAGDVATTNIDIVTLHVFGLKQS